MNAAPARRSAAVCKLGTLTHRVDAIEFLFLLPGQGMDQDNPVDDSALRMAAMGTGVLCVARGKVMMTEVEFIHLIRPKASDIGAAFKSHEVLSCVPLQAFKEANELPADILSHPQNYYKM